MRLWYFTMRFTPLEYQIACLPASRAVHDTHSDFPAVETPRPYRHFLLAPDTDREMQVDDVVEHGPKCANSIHALPRSCAEPKALPTRNGTLFLGLRSDCEHTIRARSS